MNERLWKTINRVKQQSPLIHNITNYVVMNNTANALLASGASPLMAHAHPEMESMPAIAQALVINIGTLDEYWVTAMKKAIATANQQEKPWVLDPVGAGATPYRNTVLAELLSKKPAVIRGNASEIMALAKQSAKTKGVDSDAKSDKAIDAARMLQEKYNSIVCISGETDIVLGKHQEIHLKNGDAMMTHITGMGCTASALVAAFCAVEPDYFIATTAAMAYLGVCGSLTSKSAKGPGSFQMELLDQLYTLSEANFLETLHIHHASH